MAALVAVGEAISVGEAVGVWVAVAAVWGWMLAVAVGVDDGVGISVAVGAGTSWQASSRMAIEIKSPEWRWRSKDTSHLTSVQMLRDESRRGKEHVRCVPPPMLFYTRAWVSAMARGSV